jgi:4-amino-4-deoxy-L-arabinose transferase-like glycosyltransferase
MTIDDEGGYAVVAHELLEGGTLYRSALDRRPPLIFWIYKAIFLLVGKYNWFGFHVVAVAWIVLTMAGLYATGRELFSQQVGLAAAFLYSICTARCDWQNLAFNGEIMMTLPIVWALYLAFKRETARRNWELALGGTMLACAFLIKQPAAIAAIPVGCYLLLPSYRAKRRLSLGKSFIQAAILTTGYFLTLGIVVLILRREGILMDALHWTILDHDLPHGPTDQVFWKRGVKETLGTAAAWHPLLLLSAVSLWECCQRGTRYWEGLKAELTALLLLLGVSWIGVCASGRFYSHYFFQLLPPLVLLGAPVFTAIWTGTRTYGLWLLRSRTLQFILLGSAAAFLLINAVRIWPLRTPSPLSQYVRQHSEPQDKVFFWGQRDWYYAEAQRRPASRFILSFPLTGYIFGSPLSDDPDYDTSYRIMPGAWDILQEEFLRNPPVFFVDTDPGSEANKYPPSRYPYLRRLLRDRYKVVFTTPEGTVYRRAADQVVLRKTE